MSQACKGKQEAHGTSGITETTVPTFSISSGTNDFGLEACINRVRTRSCLVDTGAAVSLISDQFWGRVKGKDEQVSSTGFNHKLVCVQGAPLQLCGSTRVRLEIDGLQKVFFVDVRVVKSLTNDVILG